jgi:hypothetical protein
MKLLIPTATIPTKKNIRIIYVENISPYLKEKIDLEIIWLHISPKQSEYDDKSLHILNFNQFSNAYDLLNKIKPDCILVSSSWDSIQYSLSMACQFFKIPAFFLYMIMILYNLKLILLILKVNYLRSELFFQK